MGSFEHSLSLLSIYGSLQANGENKAKFIRELDGGATSDTGAGGGSGGTILLFLHALALGNSSAISAVGGLGSTNGGGGGGGRVHFHWSDISTGDEYQPTAIVKGTISVRFVLILSCYFDYCFYELLGLGFQEWLVLFT